MLIRIQSLGFLYMLDRTVLVIWNGEKMGLPLGNFPWRFQRNHCCRFLATSEGFFAAYSIESCETKFAISIKKTNTFQWLLRLTGLPARRRNEWSKKNNKRQLMI